MFRGDGSVDFSGCYVLVSFRRTASDGISPVRSAFRLYGTGHSGRKLMLYRQPCALSRNSGRRHRRLPAACWETKGDANDRSDGISVFEGNYIGKAIFSVPALGYFVAAVQSGRGKILGLTGIVCLLISGAFLRETKVKKN